VEGLENLPPGLLSGSGQPCLQVGRGQIHSGTLAGYTRPPHAAHRDHGCPVVPVAIGGLPLDWTPETVILSATETDGPEPPFHINVRIGKPITPTGESHSDLEKLRDAVARPVAGHSHWLQLIKEDTIRRICEAVANGRLPATSGLNSRKVFSVSCPLAPFTAHAVDNNFRTTSGHSPASRI
jgi:hypothetical protein